MKSLIWQPSSKIHRRSASEPKISSCKTILAHRQVQEDALPSIKSSCGMCSLLKTENSKLKKEYETIKDMYIE